MTGGGRVVVIGAGVGGLTAAALLVKAGRRVTVLEAQAYPGGSAGTFYHQGYRFDAGATLAGGFAPGGPHARVAELLGIDFPVTPVDPAWVVHLPGLVVTQWGDRARWQQERSAAFPGSEPFWRRQERLAAAAWDISARDFPFPPSNPRELTRLLGALRPSTLSAIPYLFSTLRDLLPYRLRADPLLLAFLDAQLLISAQTVTARASALYGSAALDLPRRGVNNLAGGIGSLSERLVEYIRADGGEVLYRQAVTRVETRNGRAVAVLTGKGLRLECDTLVANLTPAALAALLGAERPPRLAREAILPADGWGAFTLYLGLDAARLPTAAADHHQVVMDLSQPLGEGNSVFLSLSPSDDPRRVPPGMRAATLSSHTRPQTWWRLFNTDRAAYAALKDDYTQRLLDAAERALPGIRGALRLSLPGTPLTFQYYTRRPLGQVGGRPQTSLLGARGPATGLANAWLVGDTLFPGQSTAGVTLGALRVTADILSPGANRQK